MDDYGSRILLLSHSPQSAKYFVDKISPGAELPSSAASHSIPWTISNKYYTADVHFQNVHLPPQAEDITLPSYTPDVPAVLFVWTLGQDYKKHATSISQYLRESNCEPDVCLAIRVPASDSATLDENESDVDEFLSSLGFEFLVVRDTEEEEGTSDIPGLARALDALSTIMWPTMVPHTRSNPSSFKKLTTDWRQDTSLDTTVSDGDEEDDIHDPRRHLDELARWLDEPDLRGSHRSIRDDPWANAVSSTGFSTSPPPLGHKEKLGFEDDFTVFISAPPPPTQDADDDIFVTSPTSGGLGVSPLYHSLGSMSDLGELDDDDDLPSQSEVLSTSTRIFNPAMTEGGVFDLSTVLSTLEGMKEEISSMTDEDERRRAAARVALGLVYGLDHQKAEN